MPPLISRSGHIKYFGQLTWGNFFDWLITFCLGGIIALFTASLGGVRADTHVALLPLFMLLLILHGIWLVVEKNEAKHMSLSPLLFLPFLFWAWINVESRSPTLWLGRIELIYAIEAFILFWVSVNNVRTRAHLWALVLISLSAGAYAIAFGFYQFFQNPKKIADSLAEHSIQLSPDFLGQATGSFADPNSFATFLLILLPAFLIATIVPRLPTILRVFAGYVSIMFILALAMTKLFWPLFVLVPVVIVVSLLSFKGLKAKILFLLIGLSSLVSVIALMALLHPSFGANLEKAATSQGEGVRLELWAGAVTLLKDAPLMGVGGGAFSHAFAQSPEINFDRIAQSPHNDFILVLTQYGGIGLILLLGPIAFVLLRGITRWQAEPSRVKRENRKTAVMPTQKLFLSLGIASFIIFLFCAFCNFIFYVPALTFYGLLFFTIIVKSSTKRSLKLPRSAPFLYCYASSGVVLALVLFAQAGLRLEAHAKELELRQRLDHLITKGAHISGDQSLLLKIIEGLQNAQLVDPENVDVLLGISIAQCQRYYESPGDYGAYAESAVNAAKQATELSPTNAEAWAQLGVAYALRGKPDSAKDALIHALELAPNNSNVHYYWAAYLSNDPESLNDALRSVNHALDLNPNNEAARQLHQKLLIL